MKGIVFTELLEMAETKFGDEVIDRVIEKANLESGGAYTSVGSYPHSEIIELLRCFSAETGVSQEELLVEFGEYLFGVFTKVYSTFFENETSAFEFLSKIESKIHPEVHKLYPDAELPRFSIIEHSDAYLEMVYHSERQMGKFAEGLIRGSLGHFKEEANINSESFDDGRKVRFVISK